jgi:hypothetical protein
MPQSDSKKRAIKKTPKPKSATGESKTKHGGKHWTFPKNSLEDALGVARALEEKNGGNPLPAADVAVAVGFKQPNDWRFLDLLRSANQYGLVTGTGARATVHMAELGQDIVAPSSPSQRAQALLKAFRNVSEFEAVEKHYGGKRIPEDEFFFNTLTRDFSVPRDRTEQFAKVFLDNLKYLRAFVPAPEATASVSSKDERLLTPSAGTGTTTAESASADAKVLSKEPRAREFLDTCFVMMPFGTWFDTYYTDIYIPAIREAGFEPVRADELFTTGSVVEQVWDQIEKSKVLLADLSGKNPNVFYELGLAHAARKPVVFTAADLDDVPFDLRHLRVITYEVRDPDWSAKLKGSVTDYLRNAAKDPDKSIPHPFRKDVSKESGLTVRSTGRSPATRTRAG